MKLSTVVQQCLPYTVAVIAPNEEFLKQMDDNPDMDIPEPMGVGSGFIIDDKGHIITNHHVIAQGSSKHIEILLTDGKRLPAKLVGSSKASDIAVLKIKPFPGMTPAPMAKDDSVDFGQSVFAIGCPLGLESTVTRGVVSNPRRHDRHWKQRYGDMTILPILQTDTPINPGNSGGPLFNREGKVVGVNTFILMSTVVSATPDPDTPRVPIGQAVGSIGLGFAIKAEGAFKTATKIILKGGNIGMDTTGISFVPPTARDRFFFRDPAAVISEVAPDSAAQKAGFRPGDRVCSVCGEQTPTAADVREKLFLLAGTGQTATFQVERSGLKSRKTLRMTVPEEGTPAAPAIEPARSLLQQEDAGTG